MAAVKQFIDFEKNVSESTPFIDKREYKPSNKQAMEYINNSLYADLFTRFFSAIPANDDDENIINDAAGSVSLKDNPSLSFFNSFFSFKGKLYRFKVTLTIDTLSDKYTDTIADKQLEKVVEINLREYDKPPYYGEQRRLVSSKGKITIPLNKLVQLRLDALHLISPTSRYDNSYSYLLDWVLSKIIPKSPETITWELQNSIQAVEYYAGILSEGMFLKELDLKKEILPIVKEIGIPPYGLLLHHCENYLLNELLGDNSENLLPNVNKNGIDLCLISLDYGSFTNEIEDIDPSNIKVETKDSYLLDKKKSETADPSAAFNSPEIDNSASVQRDIIEPEKPLKNVGGRPPEIAPASAGRKKIGITLTDSEYELLLEFAKSSNIDKPTKAARSLLIESLHQQLKHL